MAETAEDYRGHCKTCKYFNPPPVPHLIPECGECRRHAPTNHQEGLPWPPVEARHWCGDFEILWPPRE